MTDEKEIRPGFEWWDRLCRLPVYSFFSMNNGVRRVEDKTGNWIERSAAQAVVDDAQAEINELRGRLARLAPAAASPVAEPVEVTESADELPSGVQMIALRRFAECCEDSDAGGHDVRKETVKSLCELGALRSVGFGRHETTKYGDWLLERDAALAQRGGK